MFDTLIGELCEAEGLIDVALSGKATQSSMSKWSRSDDPMRALCAHNDPFAFHTEYEHQPWWQLDLGQCHAIEYIVVHNRRKRFQERAQTLVVEISEDKQGWMQIHGGRCHFGALPDSLPLILRLAGQWKARFVRLSLAERGYLHLSRVQVLSRERHSSMTMQSTTFLAARNDGFGVRLKAILNAMVLAEHFGADFRFRWELRDEREGAESSHHAIRPVAGTFAKGFLEKFYDESAHTPSYARLPPDAHFLDAMTQGSKRKFLVGQYDLLERLPSLKGRVTSCDFRRCFNEIEFVPSLEEAKSKAWSERVSDAAIAIHLRAGDIIYGRHRFTDRFSEKVIPHRLAAALVQRARAAGRTVVLFGQDSALCGLLARNYGAVLASDLVDRYGFDKQQAALYEIVLMSRCTEIYAGTSRFAEVAALIGDGTIRELMTSFSTAEAAAIISDNSVIRDEFQIVTDLQRAFSYWYGFHICGDALPDDGKMKFLELAIRYDPENAFYRFVMACLHCDATDFQLAEIVLGGLVQQAIEQDGVPLGGLLYLLTAKYPDGKTSVHGYAHRLHRAAESGFPHAALCLSIFAATAGQKQRALRYLHAVSGRNDGVGLVLERVRDRLPDQHLIRHIG